jgi:hypothetical protein
LISQKVEVEVQRRCYLCKKENLQGNETIPTVNQSSSGNGSVVNEPSSESAEMILQRMNESLSNYTAPDECYFYKGSEDEVCCESEASSGMKPKTGGCFKLSDAMNMVDTELD